MTIRTRADCGREGQNERFLLKIDRRESLPRFAFAQKSNRQGSMQQSGDLVCSHKFSRAQLDVGTHPPVSFDCFWQAVSITEPLNPTSRTPLCPLPIDAASLRRAAFGEHVQGAFREELSDGREFDAARRADQTARIQANRVSGARRLYLETKHQVELRSGCMNSMGFRHRPGRHSAFRIREGRCLRGVIFSINWQTPGNSARGATEFRGPVTAGKLFLDSSKLP